MHHEKLMGGTKNEKINDFIVSNNNDDEF